MWTYLALGDSLAFGETDFSKDPSYGDRGYVSLYANALATKFGGVRPNVINLGTDAETSSTFFNGGPGGDGTIPGLRGPQLNLNYPSTLPTQNALMLSTIAAENTKGHTIGAVTVQLGANDLFQVMNSPGFFGLTSAQQQAAIATALGTLQGNLTTLLLELKASAPHADILMMGYYNPYNADPSSSLDKLIDPAVHALNAVIAGEAKAFGVRFIDTYTPMLGHELQDTYIATGNVHPNAAGYALIEGQMVPEPSSFLLMGLGISALGVLKLRRLRRGRPLAS
jgi:lysophospholipase L1-like esterase